MMNRRTLEAAALICLAFLAPGCGNDGASPPAPPPGVGPAGGTVTGPGGAQIVIPPGALATVTPIAISASSAGAPALPPTVRAAGDVYALTPHGTAFSAAATLSIQFDPARVAAGEQVSLLKTNAAGTAWETVAFASAGANAMLAAVTSFSWVVAGVTEVIAVPPERAFELAVYNPNGEVTAVPGSAHAAVYARIERGPEFGTGPIALRLIATEGVAFSPPPDPVLETQRLAFIAVSPLVADGDHRPTLLAEGTNARGETVVRRLQLTLRVRSTAPLPSLSVTPRLIGGATEVIVTAAGFPDGWTAPLFLSVAGLVDAAGRACGTEGQLGQISRTTPTASIFIDTSRCPSGTYRVEVRGTTPPTEGVSVFATLTAQF